MSRVPNYSPSRLVTKLPGSRIALPWASSGVVAPPVGLDIRARVGTSTSPTSIGNKAITGAGFQPKLLIPFGGTNIANVDTDLGIGFGAAVSPSSRAAISVDSGHGRTGSFTNRLHDNTKCFCPFGIYTYDVADFVSFNGDGCTLNWSGTVLNRELNHIFLGGTDLEVSLVQCQMNGTNANEPFAHGLSEAPTGVLFFSAIQQATPPFTEAFAFFNIGAWAGGSQFGVCVHSASGLPTSETKRILVNNAVVVGSGTSVFRSMAVSSVNATNVNVTYPVAASTYQIRFWMLAIRGAKCQVGTFNTAGSTSPLPIATPGTAPKLFLSFMLPVGTSSPNQILDGLALSIGASDGVNNVSCGITDENGVPTTNARRYQSSSSIVERWINNSLFTEATAAFSGESVVITPTTAVSSVFGQGAYLIIGS